MTKIRVVLIEPIRMHRELLELLLQGTERYDPVASVTRAADAVRCCMAFHPDVVLLNAQTPGGVSSFAAASDLKKTFPSLKVILMTDQPEHSFLVRGRQSGADSFWYQQSETESILSIVDQTVAGRQVWPAAAPSVQIGLADGSEFTRREIQVLRELVEGNTNQEIADKLGVSVNAVHHHVNNMLKKTGFQSRVKLAVTVRKLGFVIHPDEELT